MAEAAKAAGNAALSEGRLEDAVAAYTEAITLEPDNHIFHSNRSGAHARARNFAQAEADAARCIALAPGWARGYSRRGFALFSLSRFEEAAAAYEKGLGIDPDDQSLRDGLRKAQGMAGRASAGVAPPAAGEGSAAAPVAGPPRRKADVDRRRLALVVFASMVLGQVAYYGIGRGVPILYTMGFVFLAFKTGLVPVTAKRVD